MNDFEFLIKGDVGPFGVPLSFTTSYCNNQVETFTCLINHMSTNPAWLNDFLKRVALPQDLLLVILKILSNKKEQQIMKLIELALVKDSAFLEIIAVPLLLNLTPQMILESFSACKNKKIQSQLELIIIKLLQFNNNTNGIILLLKLSISISSHVNAIGHYNEFIKSIIKDEKVKLSLLQDSVSLKEMITYFLLAPDANSLSLWKDVILILCIDYDHISKENIISLNQKILLIFSKLLKNDLEMSSKLQDRMNNLALDILLQLKDNHVTDNFLSRILIEIDLHESEPVTVSSLIDLLHFLIYGLETSPIFLKESLYWKCLFKFLNCEYSWENTVKILSKLPAADIGSPIIEFQLTQAVLNLFCKVSVGYFKSVGEHGLMLLHYFTLRILNFSLNTFSIIMDNFLDLLFVYISISKKRKRENVVKILIPFNQLLPTIPTWLMSSNIDNNCFIEDLSKEDFIKLSESVGLVLIDAFEVSFNDKFSALKKYNFSILNCLTINGNLKVEIFCNQLSQRLIPFEGSVKVKAYDDLLSPMKQMPSQSQFPCDLLCCRLFSKLPFMWKVFQTFALTSPTSCISILSIIRSLIIIQIGKWNKIRFLLQKRSAGGLLRDHQVAADSVYSSSVSSQIIETQQLIVLLNFLSMLPFPLNNSACVVSEIVPADVLVILNLIWSTTKDVNIITDSPPPSLSDVQLQSIKGIFSRNISKLGAMYKSFFFDS